MSGEFNPYHTWLGIPLAEQPPNHYRLLGISPLETDLDVIANAADRQMSHVRTFQAGKNGALSQQLLNELAAAKICLLKPEKKSVYDAQLRSNLRASGPASPPVAPPSRPAATAPPMVSRAATAVAQPAAPPMAGGFDQFEPPYNKQRTNARAAEPKRSLALPLAAAGLVGVALIGAVAYAMLGRSDSPTIAKKNSSSESLTSPGSSPPDQATETVAPEPPNEPPPEKPPTAPPEETHKPPVPPPVVTPPATLPQTPPAQPPATPQTSLPVVGGAGGLTVDVIKAIREKQPVPPANIWEIEADGLRRPLGATSGSSGVNIPMNLASDFDLTLTFEIDPRMFSVQQQLSRVLLRLQCMSAGACPFVEVMQDQVVLGERVRDTSNWKSHQRSLDIFQSPGPHTITLAVRKLATQATLDGALLAPSSTASEGWLQAVDGLSLKATAPLKISKFEVTPPGTAPAGEQRPDPGLPKLIARGETINVLSLIDLSRDAKVGQWELADGALTVAAGEQESLLSFPIDPPDQYALVVKFTPSGDETARSMTVQINNFYVSFGGPILRGDDARTFTLTRQKGKFNIVLRWGGGESLSRGILPSLGGTGPEKLAIKTRGAMRVTGIDLTPLTSSAPSGTVAGLNMTPPAAPPAAPAPAPIKKVPAPSEAEQVEKLKEVKDIFKAEYASAIKLDAKGEFAKKLLAQADRTEGDSAAKYVFLAQAQQLAEVAGDPTVALQACQTICDHFEVDSLKLRVDSMLQLSKTVRAIKSRQALATIMLQTSDEVLDARREYVACSLMHAAVTVCSKLKDPALRKAAEDKQTFVILMTKLAEAAFEAGKTLKEKPDDPVANKTVGLFLCFAHDEWKQGAPHLAKCGDKGLQAIATKELDPPTQPAAQADLAQAWNDLANGATGQDKIRYQTRAFYWFNRASNGATGLLLVRVQKALNELSSRELLENRKTQKRFLLPGTGMLGRISVNNTDAGLILRYKSGADLDGKAIEDALARYSSAVGERRMELYGVVDLPAKTRVTIYQQLVGGDGIAKMYVDGKEKATVAAGAGGFNQAMTLDAGIHKLGWIYTGNKLGTGSFSIRERDGVALLPILYNREAIDTAYRPRTKADLDVSVEEPPPTAEP